jgi:hypothetical protein
MFEKNFLDTQVNISKFFQKNVAPCQPTTIREFSLWRNASNTANLAPDRTVVVLSGALNYFSMPMEIPLDGKIYHESFATKGLRRKK